MLSKICCAPPSQIVYKKGHNERKAKYTCLADPPEVELAKKNFANRSDVRLPWFLCLLNLFPFSWGVNKGSFLVPMYQTCSSWVVYSTVLHLNIFCPCKIDCARNVNHINNEKPLFNSSQLKYHEDYNKNVKGKWCETPYFDIAIARMVMDNISDVSARNPSCFPKHSLIEYFK